MRVVMLLTRPSHALGTLALALALAPTGLTAGPTDATGAPGTAPKACAKLPHRTGIDTRRVTIGNVSDIGGPAPGLHQSAQQAVAAYVAYFNATSDICGRELDLVQLDARTDGGAGEQAYRDACRRTFATIGSVSEFDSGGAKVAANCGLPDLRAATRSPERRACRTCLTTHPDDGSSVQNVLPALLKESYGGGDHAAMVYINSGDLGARAIARVRAETRRGMRFVYLAGLDPAEFNYVPFAQAMKDREVETVQFVTDRPPAATKLAQTFQQVGFHPRAYVVDPAVYSDRGYDDAGIRTIVGIDTQALAADKPSPELRLYRAWLRRTSPGATPTVEGVYAWSAARLFTTAARSLGERLTRASLVRQLRTYDAWRDGSLHAPQHVGTGRLGGCLRFLRHQGTGWVATAGGRLRCGGVTSGRPAA